MTDPNRQNENPANAAQAGEPVVSKGGAKAPTAANGNEPNSAA